MKLPAAPTMPKPMVSSSPGRPEKLPAPGLARLLRGKSAGRSRPRSAASPMFVSRSRSVGRFSAIDPALPDGGDPSSPKVTCIGQVRIRNRNRKKNKSDGIKTSRSDPYRCQCLCRLFLCRINKCYSPYRFFFCWRKQKKKVKKETAEAKVAAPPTAFVREFKIESDLEEEKAEEVEAAEEEAARVFVSSSSAADLPATHSSEGAPLPPKNALLLMRCRSAPHNRSSALAMSRLPVSPVPASETEEEPERIETAKDEMIERGRESCNGSAKDEEESRRSSASQAPAGLMRCKSEPAKKAERLMEVSYCKWNGSGKGVVRVVREVSPIPSSPPPHASPILLH